MSGGFQVGVVWLSVILYNAKFLTVFHTFDDKRLIVSGC